MSTKISIQNIPSDLKLKDIPDESEIILTSDDIQGNAYGKIKHHYTLRNEYIYSTFYVPGVSIRISKNCEIWESFTEINGVSRKSICIDM